METDYRSVTSVSEICKYIGKNRIVAFDFETSPTEYYRNEPKSALNPHKSEIIGCSFSVKIGTGIYVPVNHKKGKNIDFAEFFAFLREFLTNTDIVKVAHNISFESMFSYAKSIVIQPPVYDTMCASQMTLKGAYQFRKLSESGLKLLADELCHEPLPTFEEVTNGRFFDELDGQEWETVRYGAADSDFALRLYYIFNEWFDKYLPKHRYIVEEIESPTAVYLGIMKFNGVPMDTALMRKKKTEAEEKIKEISDKIRMLIGDVNIGANCSTKAFKDYLYQNLKLPVMKTTASSKEATDDSTMIMLKEWCDKYRPELSELFVLVQEYRKWNKIKTTYIDGYLKFVDGDYIYPDFFALSTDTGRMNCQHPNLQNAPRKGNDPIGVRNFIKALLNHLILSLDFSQIELRVGAFYCRDAVMMNTYRKNGDIHAATTSVIFGCTYEEAQDKHRPEYKEQRTIAKNVNFGTFYGLFPKGLQSTLHFKAGVIKSVQECETMLRNLKSGYPALTEWQEETKMLARRNGYSETWLGRRRYLPDITSDNWGQRSFMERCALNTPIQGTAADILKMAIVRILCGLAKHLWLKPILQIHDELTFIIPENKLDEAVAFIRECMEKQPFPEFDLPLIAEASAGHTFGTMEELN